jgi:WD40 repeat protein
MVRIWSTATLPWTELQLLSTPTTSALQQNSSGKNSRSSTFFNPTSVSPQNNNTGNNTSNSASKIMSLSWEPAGLYLAAAGINLKLAIWSTISWAGLVMNNTTTTLTAGLHHYVDWSPDNDHFVVDTTVYGIDTLQETAALQAHGGGGGGGGDTLLRTLSQWSPNGNYIATVFSNTVCIFDATSGGSAWQSVQNLTASTVKDIQSVQWSHDSTYLAVGGDGLGANASNLYVWQTANWNERPPTSVATARKEAVSPLQLW